MTLFYSLALLTALMLVAFAAGNMVDRFVGNRSGSKGLAIAVGAVVTGITIYLSSSFWLLPTWYQAPGTLGLVACIMIALAGWKIIENRVLRPSHDPR